MILYAVFVGLILLVVLVFCYSLWQKTKTSTRLMSQTIPFEMYSDAYSTSVLVLGDSIAVGVGASRPAESVPGLFAKEVDATYVENHAISGSQVRDLLNQISKATLSSYTYILIQIGANDVTHAHNVDDIARDLSEVMRTLPLHQHLFVLMAGNVGGASAFPRFVKPYYTRLSLRYHKEFARVVAKNGGIYIDLFTDPKEDPIVLHPEIYLAEDGFHPSSEGYALWFEKIKKSLAH